MTISFKKLLKHEEIIEYSKLKGPIALLAFHGGGIESGTEQICRFIEENTNCSLYVISARAPENNFRFHVPSIKINPIHSHKLHKVIENCTTGIAIHGHAKKRYSHIVFISGRNKDLKIMLSEVLNEVLNGEYKIRTNRIPEDLDCDDPRNVLNKFEFQGVQIELPISLRQFIEEKDKNNYENSNLFGKTKELAEAIAELLGN